MTEGKKGPGKGSALVLASAAFVSMLAVWEPSKTDPGLVYADRLANGLPTVCRGLTKYSTDQPVIVGERWSVEKCEREEQKAIEALQRRLLACFKEEPPQSVFDAASSHAWNFGVGATCGSQSMLAWNARKWELGCMRLARSDDGRAVWSFVRDGVDPKTGRPKYKFVQGLRNRRESEVDLCLSGL